MTNEVIDWKERYYNLLEKHNDSIDELMGQSGLEGCPDIFMIVKFINLDIDLDEADIITKKMIYNMELKNIKYCNILFSNDKGPADMDITAIPLKSLLFQNNMEYCDEMIVSIKEYLKGVFKNEYR